MEERVLEIFDSLIHGTECSSLSQATLKRFLGTNFLARKYMASMGAPGEGISRHEWRAYFSALHAQGNLELEAIEREFHTDLRPGVRVADRFEIGELLGRGTFGTVFAASELNPRGGACAVKFEWGMTRALKNEVDMMRACADMPSVPAVRWEGECMGCRAIAMDLVGVSLSGAAAEIKFGPRARLFELAEDMWRVLAELHSRQIVHRDIKPDNWCLPAAGVKSQSRIFLVDFGLATRDPNKSAAGTPTFKSPHTHQNLGPSALDDAFGHLYTMLSLLLDDGLPWNGIEDGVSSTQEKDRILLEAKNEAHKAVSYTHLRAHETPEHLVCRLLLEKKKKYIEQI
eukprot:TRINITY_DN36583_c0_g1_i1.p1 TRINITY_DN36583_c0_g1~~TRINITY_DN36583_c0_g1_i1.p1  ORF type:complete len:343 (-),score=69.48 TRINITY_DN36583_c0_g1_i1:58-1086(-)